MNNLDHMTIDDYFREYSHYHVKKATELLQPLHTPGRTRCPTSPRQHASRSSPRHVIAAAVTMLDENAPRRARGGGRIRQNADENADDP